MHKCLLCCSYNVNQGINFIRGGQQGLYISRWGCEFVGKGYQRKPQQWAPTNSIDSTLNEYFKKRMMHVSCN